MATSTATTKDTEVFDPNSNIFSDQRPNLYGLMLADPLPDVMYSYSWEERSSMTTTAKLSQTLPLL